MAMGDIRRCCTWRWLKGRLQQETSVEFAGEIGSTGGDDRWR